MVRPESTTVHSPIEYDYPRTTEEFEDLRKRNTAIEAIRIQELTKPKHDPTIERDSHLTIWSERRFSSYRIGDTLIDRMEKPELLAAVAVFAGEASMEMLREFLKDIADAAE